LDITISGISQKWAIFFLPYLGIHPAVFKRCFLILDMDKVDSEKTIKQLLEEEKEQLLSEINDTVRRRKSSIIPKSTNNLLD